MQGSPNPLILRNYRMIPPLTWKFFNLSVSPTNFPGQHIPDRDIQLVFKVEAAPVVLPYESELILKFTFASDPTAARFKNVSNQWAPNPLYRIKGKSMAHIVKRCWATISNMTFQSYRPPAYLNEILLRKPAHLQQKYPDNYTGEKSIYLGDLVGGNKHTLDFANPPLVTGTLTNQFALYLELLSRTISNDGQLYFMTPQFNVEAKDIILNPGDKPTTQFLTTLTFRIPFTELLPVFKIGVIPLVMIASNSFDMWIDLYKPADWFVNLGIGTPVALETYLNVTTVSFPDINPLAEALIRPRIYDGRFIAPFLDYLVFETRATLNQPEVQFFFNVTQFLRNVPFICLSFTDETTYTPLTVEEKTPESSRNPNGPENAADDCNIILEHQSSSTSGNWGASTSYRIRTNPRHLVTGIPNALPLSATEAERGGFFNLPPHVSCKDVNIMLGESAFPLTQVPMSWDDMYMYNRKHFEMYGRDFNVYRVSPIGRANSGDASFFFDLSHSPMTGFQIGPSSPLQLVGKLKKDSAVDHEIKIILTCYYSNNFNAMLASGGVVPLQ